MLSSQYNLPIHSELVVDLFAGGGGASTGIEMAIGRAVDVAVNHDPQAISLHKVNHPQTMHHISDVYEVDPVRVTAGQRIGLLWASPDCSYHSKARGGKPFRDRNKARRRRGLANVVTKWVRKLKPTNQHPRVIVAENVEEFQQWGPLMENGQPCPERKGQNFQRWVAELRNLGYQVDWRELRASDHNTPTIRKRLFVIARCDGQPIVWPAATHGAPDSLPVRHKKLQPYKTAADIIDWSIPVPSIFERKKPLADSTCRRIAKGIMRYVVNAKEPFIVTNTTGHPGASISAPVRTITTGGHHALCVPTLMPTGPGEREEPAPRALDAGEPLEAAVGAQKRAMVQAFLAKHYTGVAGTRIDHPVGTVTTSDHHSLVTATLVTIDNQSSSGGHSPVAAPLKTTVTENRHALVAAHLVHMGHGEGKGGGRRFSHGIRGALEPLNTVTASGMPAAIVTSHMVKLRGSNIGAATDEPLHTISAQGTHHAEVRAFLLKYYGTDQDPKLGEPMHTITTKHRFGLVTVHGQDYEIVDIGLRMLSPRELFRAQGFPESYQIDKDANGKPLTQKAQVRMCGNSVCPPLAEAIVRANYTDALMQRQVA